MAQDRRICSHQYWCLRGAPRSCLFQVTGRPALPVSAQSLRRISQSRKPAPSERDPDEHAVSSCQGTVPQQGTPGHRISSGKRILGMQAQRGTRQAKLLRNPEFKPSSAQNQRLFLTCLQTHRQLQCHQSREVGLQAPATDRPVKHSAGQAWLNGISHCSHP